MGIIFNTQAASKVVRPLTFIPEKHTFLKLYERPFVGIPHFNLFWRCIFEHSFGVTPSESHYATTYQKQYKKTYKTMQCSCLHPQVAKLLLATMETGKGDAKCQVLQALKSLPYTAESQGTSMLARTKEHMSQNKLVKCSFSIYNLPCVVAES